MEIGMIGLGRMGTDMVRSLLKAGNRCTGYDIRPEPIQALGYQFGGHEKKTVAPEGGFS